MKTIRNLSLLACLCAILFASCSKIKEALFPAFDSELDEMQISVPLTIQGVEWSGSKTISFNLDSVIKGYTANAFGVNGLSSVTVKSVGIFLSNTDALNDLSNFETLRLSFASNTVPAPVVVASTIIPDSPATSLNITTSNPPNLKEQLKGTELTYTVAARARRATTKVLNVTVLVTLAIK